MAAKAKPRRRRPKQQFLDPDLAPPSIPELDQAAEVYFEAMQERPPYTKAEAEAKESLILAMVKHGQVKYKSADGLEVDLTDSKNVKVKRKKSAEENGDGE